MKIRLPLLYEEGVIPPKSRKVRNASFLEWVEVEILELSPSEAPVAVEWDDQHHYSTTSVGGVEQRRWDGNRFYQPATYNVSRQPNVHIDVETLRSSCAKGNTYGNPLLSGIDWRIQEAIHKRLAGVNPADYRAVLTDNRSKAIEEAHRIAEDVIVVDGKVWVASQEPVYRLRSSWFSSDRTRYVSAEFIGADEANEKPSECFRLDKFDHMADHAEANHGGRPPEEYRARVIIPEALSYDDETPAFIAALTSEVNATKSGIGDHGRETVEAWLDLRDALWALEVSRDVDEALPATQAWIDVLESSGRKSTWAEAAVKRWLNRPIELGTYGPKP
mgnify:CR=1 FL=1